MKNIISFNFNAVICIQEFIQGTNRKYLNQLQEAFPLFHVFKPEGFNELEHPRSLITVTLVHDSYKYNPIPFDCNLPNRISYGQVWLNDVPLRILNVYTVQTAIFSSGAAAWYIANRKKQKEQLWADIISEAQACTDPLLLVGDMQETTKAGIHIKQLTDLGFREKNGLFPTVKNKNFQEWGIDHFLYNKAAWEKFYPSEFQFDGHLMDELSDHVLLAAISS